MNEEQRAALRELNAAIEKATTTGLFDFLVSDCNNPDSINDVCDVVSHNMQLVSQAKEDTR